ncbi:MAG: cell division protein FtsZ [Clostridia bacterium]|nr:cell division protein FtsZ [Clostridia bacterium]
MFDNSSDSVKIRVVGVGGAGNNAVNNIINSGNVRNVEYYAINTDKQPLIRSKAENKIQIGKVVAMGLGAGADPELGAAAAEENRKEIEEMCEGTHLLFIAAGMGGGTGTGASPVIAGIAREKGCLTVAVVTKPFAFEGDQRHKNAEDGIEKLKKVVDMLIIIPNEKLLQTLSSDTTVLSAFGAADEYLKQGICGIVDLIERPSLINLDFADLRTVIKNQGVAHMGRGRAEGKSDDRVIEAVRKAVFSPFIETTIEGAKNVIINIEGGRDLTLKQVNKAVSLIKDAALPGANIIFGTNINPDREGFTDVTIIATGFDTPPKERRFTESDKTSGVTFDFFDKPAAEPDPIRVQPPQKAEESVRGQDDASARDPYAPPFVSGRFGDKK